MMKNFTKSSNKCPIRERWVFVAELLLEEILHIAESQFNSIGPVEERLTHLKKEYIVIVFFTQRKISLYIGNWSKKRKICPFIKKICCHLISNATQKFHHIGNSFLI
ncbi:uncharacterized protein LOC127280853 [Leptopilina boulardi]|uniref:uncharacterized protein LOC127280853 n=1 Tax=Leptopilina boulardi TaxID=63433 RepID=UPI0021F50269|nr:uncharacterized protein LOC127280853 [Leptopilina boulardi]